MVGIRGRGAGHPGTCQKKRCAIHPNGSSSAQTTAAATIQSYLYINNSRPPVVRDAVAVA